MTEPTVCLEYVVSPFGIDLQIKVPKIHPLSYLCCIMRKPVFRVSHQVRHKPDFTAIEADLCLCFSYIQKHVFSPCGSQSSLHISDLKQNSEPRMLMGNVVDIEDLVGYGQKNK